MITKRIAGNICTNIEYTKMCVLFIPLFHSFSFPGVCIHSRYSCSYIPTIIHRTEKYKKHIAHSTHIIKRCYRVICTGKTENIYEHNDFPSLCVQKPLTGVNVTSIWLCFAEFSLQFEIKPIGFVVSSLLVF